MNYIQADNSGFNVLDNGVYNPLKIVNGDGTVKGDEICIGEECFYVMYSDETTVTMLAKYNLYVGGDGAGITRGLAQAGASGVWVARDIISKEEK